MRPLTNNQTTAKAETSIKEKFKPRNNGKTESWKLSFKKEAVFPRASEKQG